MKTIFVTYNQAYNEEIVDLFESFGQRGFTRWEDVEGRGSESGEPHMGSHAWPVLNQAVLCVVEDSRVDEMLAALRSTDEKYPDLGLRAFVWNIEKSI